MANDDRDWRAALQEDEPPPWAVMALRDAAGGRDKLARQLNTSPTTVSRWCMSREAKHARAPQGSAVAAMRLLAEKLDREGD